MSQEARETKLRADVRMLCEIRVTRRLFAVEERRLRELERDLAKIDARKAAKSGAAGRDLATKGTR